MGGQRAPTGHSSAGGSFTLKGEAFPRLKHKDANTSHAADPQGNTPLPPFPSRLESPFPSRPESSPQAPRPTAATRPALPEGSWEPAAPGAAAALPTSRSITLQLSFKESVLFRDTDSLVRPGVEMRMQVAGTSEAG